MDSQIDQVFKKWPVVAIDGPKTWEAFWLNQLQFVWGQISKRNGIAKTAVIVSGPELIQLYAIR